MHLLHDRAELYTVHEDEMSTSTVTSKVKLLYSSCMFTVYATIEFFRLEGAYTEGQTT